MVGRPNLVQNAQILPSSCLKAALKQLLHAFCCTCEQVRKAKMHRLRSKDAIDKIAIMDNPNWRAVLSMCTEHDPDSRFSGSECKYIERFCFYVNFKIPKRQFVRGGIKKMQIPSCPRHI
jgi:hypothetical protein